jgi:restriction endonuclease Mrr
MFPMYREIEQPLVDEIRRRGGNVHPRDKDSHGRTVYEALADHFKLTDEARGASIMENGKPRSKWENMVRFARRKLKDDGIIAEAPHGCMAADGEPQVIQRPTCRRCLTSCGSFRGRASFPEASRIPYVPLQLALASVRHPA